MGSGRTTPPAVGGLGNEVGGVPAAFGERDDPVGVDGEREDRSVLQDGPETLLLVRQPALAVLAFTDVPDDRQEAVLPADGGRLEGDLDPEPAPVRTLQELLELLGLAREGHSICSITASWSKEWSSAMISAIVMSRNSSRS